MIAISRISTDDPLYPDACRLRSRILLEPLGYDIDRFRAEYPAADRDGLHFVAVLEHRSGRRVVGTSILIPHHPTPGCGKVMQVAVDPQRRREGIGRRLMIEIERHAFGLLGLHELMCHAQLPAVPFYDSLGWYAVSEIFEEAGIEHRRMIVRSKPEHLAPDA